VKGSVFEKELRCLSEGEARKRQGVERRGRGEEERKKLAAEKNSSRSIRRHRLSFHLRKTRSRAVTPRSRSPTPRGPCCPAGGAGAGLARPFRKDEREREREIDCGFFERSLKCKEQDDLHLKKENRKNARALSRSLAHSLSDRRASFFLSFFRVQTISCSFFFLLLTERGEKFKQKQMKQKQKQVLFTLSPPTHFSTSFSCFQTQRPGPLTAPREAAASRRTADGSPWSFAGRRGRKLERKRFVFFSELKFCFIVSLNFPLSQSPKRKQERTLAARDGQRTKKT